MKYRKKPVVIKAFQMTKERMWDNADWPSWLHVAWQLSGSTPGVLLRGTGDTMVIGTLEGNMVVSPNDWIIEGIHGEIYPCKPDIFAATYEPVEE